MRIGLLFTLFGLLFSCQQDTTSALKKHAVLNSQVDTFPINGSIRAIEVVSAESMWYAGGKGQYGFTEDAGKTWQADSIKIDGKPLEFRSIAITQDAVFLLSVSSPALLFKSEDKGQNWKLVYKEALKNTYYNSLKFWDEREGIAVGDPTDGCLSVIITRNGGDTWEKLTCENLPKAEKGEAGFAASNTNIAVYGQHVWLVTGGSKARVIHSADRGKSWEVYETPIIQGGKMTGIFSVDFLDENRGIIFGGDWENQEDKLKCKAITQDGGRTWSLLNDGKEPGFRSCVQYVPKSDGKEIFAVGSPGISFSQDAGKSWERLSEEGFYTIRVANSGKSAWLAGKNRIGLMRW